MLARARSWWHENNLSLVLGLVFVVLLAGQVASGYLVHNDDRREHGLSQLSFAAYLTSGHLLEATAENWESEFLQMGAYVLLTVFLRQKGSAESKGFGKEKVDQDPRTVRHTRDTPWPVRRGGVWLVLYENSLGLAFLVMFAVSFVLHAVGGAKQLAEESLAHGEPAGGLGDYLLSSRFWFESLQNWQSEFLAVLAIVVLSIFLRQRGSPESKPVAAPHHETGE